MVEGINISYTETMRRMAEFENKFCIAEPDAGW